MNIETTPLAQKKFLRSRITHRTSTSRPKDNEGQLSIQYFSQLLDIETVCYNALRSLRNDDSFNNQFVEDLQSNEWMYKFDVPISIKY